MHPLLEGTGELSVFLGRNNAAQVGGSFLVANYLGDPATISDPTVARTFDLRGGTVRVLRRIDANDDGRFEASEPTASIVCPNLDTVIAVVAPA